MWMVLLLLLCLLCIAVLSGYHLAARLPAGLVAGLAGFFEAPPPLLGRASACECCDQHRVVSPEFSAALDSLLDRLLSLGLERWSEGVGPGSDRLLRGQLRRLLAPACRRLLSRWRRIDLAALLVQRVLPAAFRHLDCCLLARRLALARRGAVSPPHSACALLQLYGGGRHMATAGDADQGKYVRALTRRLLACLLPEQSDGDGDAGFLLLRSEGATIFVTELLCERMFRPLLDLLTQPETVNQLLSLLLECSSVSPTPPSIPTPSLLPDFASAPSPRDSYSAPAAADPGHYQHPVVEPDTGLVPLLSDWTDHAVDPGPDDECSSPFRCDLATVLRSSHLLYAFTQCLRSRNALAPLQFCLAVDTLLAHLLSPELTVAQLQRLRNELSSLLSCYLLPSAPDRVCVRADSGVVATIERAVAGPPEGVIRLQKSSALFSAYELVYSRLELHHATAFTLSGHLIDSVLQRVEPSLSALSRGRGSSRSLQFAGAVTRLGRRLRDVIRAPTVSGRVDLVGSEVDPGTGDIDETGVDCIDSYAQQTADHELDLEHERAAIIDCENDDDSSGEAANAEEELEEDDEDEDSEDWPVESNLGLWTVEIPLVSMAVGTSGKQLIVFILDVQCPWAASMSGPHPPVWDENPAQSEHDLPPPSRSVGKHWRTVRQLNEFYVLERRLCEFHGQLGGVSLPPRQSLLSGSFYTQDFLDARKPPFVSFLHGLMASPVLSHSQLVRAFLTSSEPFVDDSASFPALVDINLARMIRTVPKKFRKERGQCLDSLLTALVVSTRVPANVSCPADDDQPLSRWSSAVSISSSGRPPDFPAILGELATHPEREVHGQAGAMGGTCIDDSPAAGAVGRGLLGVVGCPIGEESVRPRGVLSGPSLFDHLITLLCRVLEQLSSSATSSSWWHQLSATCSRWSLALLCAVRSSLEKPLNWVAYRWLSLQLKSVEQSAIGCRLIQLAENAIFDDEARQYGSAEAGGSLDPTSPSRQTAESSLLRSGKDPLSVPRAPSHCRRPSQLACAASSGVEIASWPTGLLTVTPSSGRHTRHLSLGSAGLIDSFPQPRHHQMQERSAPGTRSHTPLDTATGSEYSAPRTSAPEQANTGPVSSSSSCSSYDRLLVQLTETPTPAAALCLAVLTGGRWNHAAQILLQCVQSPVANKQLLHVLLDELVLALFPELNNSELIDSQKTTQHPSDRAETVQ